MTFLEADADRIRACAANRDARSEQIVEEALESKWEGLEESLSTDRDNRQAAMKAIGNMAFADRVNLLRRFVDDADADIRLGAHILIR